MVGFLLRVGFGLFSLLVGFLCLAFSLTTLVIVGLGTLTLLLAIGFRLLSLILLLLIVPLLVAVTTMLDLRRLDINPQTIDTRVPNGQVRGSQALASGLTPDEMGETVREVLVEVDGEEVVGCEGAVEFGVGYQGQEEDVAGCHAERS